MFFFFFALALALSFFIYLLILFYFIYFLPPLHILSTEKKMEGNNIVKVGIFENKYPIWHVKGRNISFFQNPLEAVPQTSSQPSSENHGLLNVYIREGALRGQVSSTPHAVSLDLILSNMVSTTDAFTNHLFINTEDFNMLQLELVGGIVCVAAAGFQLPQNLAPPTTGRGEHGRSSSDLVHFLPVTHSASVPKGKVLANALQRHQLNMCSGVKVYLFPLPLFTDPDRQQWASIKGHAFPAVPLQTLTVEVVVLKGVKKVDCEKFSRLFCEALDYQCITVGREVLIPMDALILSVCVKEMQLKDPLTGKVFPAQKLTGDDRKNGFHLSDGVINAVTILSSSTLSPSDIVVLPGSDDTVLEGRSTKQLDMQQQQLIQSFKLENLGIGGLRSEFTKVFERAFASRALPLSVLKKLGIKHVKGVLLYGPPGTGKTLIARKIGEILNCRQPKIINGPELFNKYVGQSEENVRKLFAEAIEEHNAKGEQSQLHLLIFDEFDSLCKTRGGQRSDQGVGDNVVNQLLSMIDGVNALPNVLLIGMTNRLDLIDEAIKRPGRFEVLVEIGLPNEEGRQEIFRIHTATMRASHLMASDVDLAKLARDTKNYSGAEIEGVVRAATSSALRRHMDLDTAGAITDTEHLMITKADFEHGLQAVPPAFGRGEEMCEELLRGGIIDYGTKWQRLLTPLEGHLKTFTASHSKVQSITMMLHGPGGSGKSAVAAYVAKRTCFPYVKVISAEDMVGAADASRISKIQKVFDDAYKSQESCVILDDLESLVSYSAMGMRYSNDVLQALLVLIKRLPPPGRRIFVIGTSTDYHLMEMLNLNSVFSLSAEIFPVGRESIPFVCKQYGYTFGDTNLEEDMPNILLSDIPIKRIPYMLEMISDEKKCISRSLLESFSFTF